MRMMVMVIAVSMLLLSFTGAYDVSSVAQENPNTQETQSQGADVNNEGAGNVQPVTNEGDTSGKSNYGIFEDESKENSN